MRRIDLAKGNSSRIPAFAVKLLSELANTFVYLAVLQLISTYLF